MQRVQCCHVCYQCTAFYLTYTVLCVCFITTILYVYTQVFPFCTPHLHLMPTLTHTHTNAHTFTWIQLISDTFPTILKKHQQRVFQFLRTRSCVDVQHVIVMN